jgi:hypothetical protein
MFNPNPEIQRWPILPGQHGVVIDDALLEPARWVERAAREQAAFAMLGHNAYPGVELRLPDAASARLDEVFARHAREILGMRRTLRHYSRLALVTQPAATLAPSQSICHRDRMSDDPQERVAASVLYLFHDATLGGTNFFRPRRSPAETARLVHDSGAMTPDGFFARYGIAAGYLTESNDFFDKVQTIPARWNRLIFYDGHLFHGGDITAPDRLSADPQAGRLTMNGFFICRGKAG